MCPVTTQTFNTICLLTGDQTATPMAMIDTVHFRTHERSDLVDNPTVTDLRITRHPDGNVVHSAFLGNLYVSSRETGTSIRGSLSRFVHGTNLACLHHTEVAPALRSIESDLRMDAGSLTDARVTRLDVGSHVVLPRPVREYLACMDAPPRYRTCRIEDGTLYFRTTLRELAYYDKAAEVQRRGEPLPAELQGQHVLRYELRLFRVSRDLRREVTAGDLADPTFYRSLVRIWRDRFHTVRFRPLPRIEAPVTVPQLRDEFAAIGVETEGGKDAALVAVNAARDFGFLTDSQARRQRVWIRDLPPCTALTPQADVGAELSAAIDGIAATEVILPAV